MDCPSNCAEDGCVSVTGVCTKCNTGFQLNTVTNKCFECNVQNCDTCSGTNVCSSCADTFLLKQSTDNATGTLITTCECATGATPVTSNNVTVCGCEGDFTWTPSDTTLTVGGCQPNCGIDGCIVCTGTGADATCSRCRDYGYIPTSDSKACVHFCPSQIRGCKYCSSYNFCQECTDANQTVSTFGDSCVTCNIANCMSCQVSNVCYKCNALYSLTGNGGCRSCNVENCHTCSSTDFCSTCNGDYTPNTIGQCVFFVLLLVLLATLMELVLLVLLLTILYPMVVVV